MRHCNDCACDRPLDCFYKNRSRADGLQTVCKRCSVKRARSYQRRHPDKKRENDRTYNTRHAAQLKLKKQTYYQRTQTERAATRAQWYVRNRVANLEYQRQWRRANLEKKRAGDRAYQKENPAVYRVSRLARRARKRAASGHASRVQIQARIDYYGGKCWVPACGKDFDAIDHVISLKGGGTNWPANLRPICKSCNSAKGSKHPLVFLKAR